MMTALIVLAGLLLLTALSVVCAFATRSPMVNGLLAGALAWVVATAVIETIETVNR